jgi:hypothetical protein
MFNARISKKIKKHRLSTDGLGGFFVTHTPSICVDVIRPWSEF